VYTERRWEQDLLYDDEGQPNFYFLISNPKKKNLKINNTETKPFIFSSSHPCFYNKVIVDILKASKHVSRG